MSLIWRGIFYNLIFFCSLIPLYMVETWRSKDTIEFP